MFVAGGPDRALRAPNPRGAPRGQHADQRLREPNLQILRSEGVNPGSFREEL